MRFLILHGTGSDSQGNWFLWLKNQLEKSGHEVWLPDLPDAHRPNIQKYNSLLLDRGWDFNGSVIIGHSSGAVAIFGLLQALPAGSQINTAILVGSFTERLSQSPSWEMLRELFDQPFDFSNIKRKAARFLFIHSKDDQISPIEQAEQLCLQTGGEMIRFDDKGHFSLRQNPDFARFPELLKIINQKVIS